MRLYYLRHAQSTNNELIDTTGSDDLRNVDAPLTERGRRQAAVLADYLSAAPSGVTPPAADTKDITGFGITHLYCSLMDRAIATGTYISKKLDLPLVGWEDIHETGGIFEADTESGERRGLPGRNREVLRSAYPHLDIPVSVGNEGWWNRPFEEVEERRKRAKKVIEILKNRHSDPPTPAGGERDSSVRSAVDDVYHPAREDRVAIVSHGGFFNWIVAEILGIDRTENMWLHTNNASISRFDFIGDTIIVEYLNRTDHLPPELIT